MEKPYEYVNFYNDISVMVLYTICTLSGMRVKSQFGPSAGGNKNKQKLKARH